MILAADTSLPLLSVALVGGSGELAGAVTLVGRESRNEKLLPAIDWLLGEAGVTLKDVTVFASTRGPGSFTGVRIGLATLQGLAVAIGKPLLTLSTHDAIAAAASDEQRASSVLVTSDAGRGEFYASLFNERMEAMPPSLVTRAQRDELAASAKTVLSAEAVMERHNVAQLLALRAGEILRDGQADQHRDPSPIYVRLAEAEARLRQSGA